MFPKCAQLAVQKKLCTFSTSKICIISGNICVYTLLGGYQVFSKCAQLDCAQIFIYQKNFKNCEQYIMKLIARRGTEGGNATWRMTTQARLWTLREEQFKKPPHFHVDLPYSFFSQFASLWFQPMCTGTVTSKTWETETQKQTKM